MNPVLLLLLLQGAAGPGPATVTLIAKTAGLSDQLESSSTVSFAQARAGTGTVIFDPNPDAVIGAAQFDFGASWYIYQSGGLVFDARDAPELAGATILSASLEIYGHSEATLPVTLEIRRRGYGVEYDPEDWVAGADLGNFPLVAEYLAASAWNQAGYNQFTDVGLAASFNTRGENRYGVNDKDTRLNTNLGGSAARAGWGPLVVDAGKKPRLVITYTPAPQLDPAGDDPLYLAELTVYDSSLPGTRTLRYATGEGFVTGPGETPANAYFDARMKQPALVRRDLFDSGTTEGRSRIGFGDLELLNDDGMLDGLLEYGFDGREIVIWQGPKEGAFPSDFTKLLTGTMEQADVNNSVVTVKLRDRQYELAVPLQANKYAGDNVLPAGLEGTSDLKGKPKPVCYGKVMNVPAVLVNTSKLIYQVNDGRVSAVDMVYDKGIPLSTALPLTLRTSTFGASHINDIAYGNGLFVAVGDSGKLATSPDGITWTARTSSFGADHIHGVVYGNGKWVAVGASGKTATSTDGITWAQATSLGSAISLFSLAFGNGVFVAGGGDGFADGPVVYSSTDGVSWTLRTFTWTSMIANYVQAIAYGNGVFVAAGGEGQISTSPTGTTWTQRTSRIASTVLAGAFGAGVFVFAGGSGDIVSSVDGITWHPREADFSSDVRALGYGNGVFIAGGSNVVGNALGVSIDGINWTKRTSGLTGYVLGVGFGDGLFVVVGESGQLGTSTPPAGYTSEADLLDDELAPYPGTFKAYPAGGYFRLGSVPFGVVTADVTENSTAARGTVADIFTRVLTARAGLTVDDFSGADVTDLYAANTAVIGFWSDREQTIGEVLDQVAGSIGAWWGADRFGVFRIKQLVAPAAPAVASFDANDLLRSLERISTQDQGRGLPCWSVILRYLKNYFVQSTDLAAGVLAGRRTILEKEWREAVYSDASVQIAHILAPQMTGDSLLYYEADAQAEAQRRQELRGVRRDRFQMVVKLNRARGAIDLGHVIHLTHPRFGLSAGKYFVVIGIAPNATERSLTLSVWG